jgi:para-aminobenzoate synthetase component 1
LGRDNPGVVLRIELDSPPAPSDALNRLAGLPGRVLLESAGEVGTFSFLAADPIAVLRSAGGTTRIAGTGAMEDSEPLADPFAGLDFLLSRWHMPPPPDGVSCAGGVIGFLGYEAGDHLEHLPPSHPNDLGIPDAWFGVYDSAVVWDRNRGSCAAVASVLPGRTKEETVARLERLAERVRMPGVASRSMEGSRSRAPSPVTPGTSSLERDAFLAGVERIREYIRAGDLFQANLTRRLTVPTAMSGTELYGAMVQASPAPYAAYLDCGDAEVASISPELFLSLRGRGIATSPIKGTRPRGRTTEEDEVFRRDLTESDKDRAENVMIVDLLRNDLSRVSLPGSIAVPRLATVETHPTVHHLVSTVTGRLGPDKTIVNLLRATFPGGSVTGAPKIRAMEILRELEPVRRGVYTGALGILGFHGDAELSVAIRTAVLRDGRAHYGTGGGITLASNPEAEWAETEDKARAFLQAISPGWG